MKRQGSKFDIEKDKTQNTTTTIWSRNEGSLYVDRIRFYKV